MNRLALCTYAVFSLAVADATAQARPPDSPPREQASRRTYVWSAESAQGERLSDPPIAAAIDRELMVRGLAVAPSAAAAALVASYQVRRIRPVQVVVHAGGWQSGVGAPPAMALTAEVIGLNVTVEFRDARAGTVVWRRTAVIDLDPRASQIENGRRLEKGIRRVLKSFQPDR